MPYVSRCIDLAIAISLCVCFAADAAATDPGAPSPDVIADPVDTIRTLLRQDRWQEALRLCEPPVPSATPELEGAVLEALFRAGRLRQVSERLETAGERLDARGWLVRARLAAASGRADRVTTALERALAAAPDDPVVLYWAADLETDSDRVRELFRRFLDRSAGQPEERIQSARMALTAFDGFHRLERDPWRPTARPERVRVPLRPVWGRTGSIDGFAVEAELGEGQKAPVKLLLDTGAHSLFVLGRIARKRGFEPLSHGEIYGGGGDRSHPVSRGLFRRFDLGGLAFADALATAAPKELDPTGRFHGLLGVAVFGGYRITLDLPGRELRLDPPSALEGGVPYWWISGQLLAEVEVSPGRTELFVLDTGATQTVLSASLVERLDQARISGPAALRGFGGQVGDARIVEGVTVRFGEAEVAGAKAAIDLSTVSRVGGVEVSGMLGLDALRGGVLTLSTAEQRLRFDEREPGGRTRR